ncbi:putative glycoside hydrolase [Bacillus daqingensis]|uniref:Glycoside hydrolase n=1 Tax=Bacillus daqingensis TaxID=872396 RepID=A0ABV9NPN1_9BACI
MKHWKLYAAGAALAAGGFSGQALAEEENSEMLTAHAHNGKTIVLAERQWPDRVARYTFDSGYHFDYPDAVRGIFVTGHIAGHPTRFDELIELVNETDLNSMVIDVKEDDGYITFEPEEGNPYVDISQPMIGDPEEMMEKLEENEIYPIARIVVFKDSQLADAQPELSFIENGNVWANPRGDKFVNPFLEEVWDYNLEVARMAAEMGFQEIQFDYVRFPEGFETRDENLEYDTGNYTDRPEDDNIGARVDAVSDFVEYAYEELQEYDVDVSVDIFGYTVTVENAPGIGQNFSRIAENVDIISSMPYPSHWQQGDFGFDEGHPDLYPYELMNRYSQAENEVMSNLEDPPVSRPWLQDFTASYLGSGNYLNYGKDEVEAQIQAIYDNEIYEFLLWNAGNRYSEGVDYLLGLDPEDLNQGELDEEAQEDYEEDSEAPDEGVDEEDDDWDVEEDEDLGDENE